MATYPLQPSRELGKHSIYIFWRINFTQRFGELKEIDWEFKDL
jgi:hypothetical protein